VSLADVCANLGACEALAKEAAAAGAEAIALPEFFTTGAAFLPELAEAALPPDGAAAEMLLGVAAEEEVLIGGSFLCRDADGEVRNAFLLAGSDGLLGRHDKDLPTMWENALYVGGDDEGVIEAGELTVGAAVCWELMRSATARRLRGRVDLVIGGSNWWSVPRWPPAATAASSRGAAGRRAPGSWSPTSIRAASRRPSRSRSASGFTGGGRFPPLPGTPNASSAAAGTRSTSGGDRPSPSVRRRPRPGLIPLSSSSDVPSERHSGKQDAPSASGQRSTREKLRLAGAAVAGTLAVLFALLNLDQVEVNWVLGSGQTPLIVVIVVSFLLGVAVDRLLAYRSSRRHPKQ
jgi:uncharacterized integral membrane protein